MSQYGTTLTVNGRTTLAKNTTVAIGNVTTPSRHLPAQS